LAWAFELQTGAGSTVAQLLLFSEVRAYYLVAQQQASCNEKT
jgi:hypothetical protein